VFTVDLKDSTVSIKREMGDTADIEEALVDIAQ
jgi:hypothetical protein